MVRFRDWISYCCIFVFALLLDTSCAAAYPEPIGAYSPPDTSRCLVHYKVIFDSNMPEWRRNWVRSSMQMWYESTQGRACLDERNGKRALPVLQVKDSYTLAIITGFEMKDVAGLYVSNGLYHSIFIVTDAVQTQDSTVIVSIHEFGHSMGLAHTSKRTSCMYPSINNKCLETNPGKIPEEDVVAFVRKNTGQDPVLEPLSCPGLPL